MSSPLATDCPTSFDVLADSRRRHLLSLLAERTEPLALERIAIEVAVKDQGAPVVTDERVRTMHIDLVHNHVPRLLEKGLLTTETDGDDRLLALADHPLFDADWIETLLENPTGGPGCDEMQLNRTLEAFRSERRRTICTVLAERGTALPVADLAAMIVARKAETRLVDVEDADRLCVERGLVHGDLPALDDAGLVEYDRSSDTVEIASDAPQWRMEWLTESPLGEITAALEGGRGRGDSMGRDTGRAASCWTLEGQADVAARGHEIANSAEDELFVTIPDADLIQQRCLECWRAAADRGVDLYIGSRSPRVRDTVRSAVPDATICEPQCDWLNFPVDRIHHGRVVFADRERVMLVTVDDGPVDGERHTTAITGDGAENTLVRLVREHVGPRMDRLESRCHGAGDGDQSTPLPL